VDTQLSSSALGDNKIRYYNAFGRIQIDLMKVVMRDYKLDSFKLDKVAENFLQGKVINIKDNELELDSLKDILLDGYIKLIDSDGELVEEGNKFKIKNIKNNKVILDRVPETSDSKLVWTMAKDDVSPNDIFRLQKGSSSDRKIIAQYCIQDCALVNKLIARLCVVINSVGMSNVCSVPLSYLFLRGQGIKIHSLVAKECRKMNYLIPVVKKNNDEVSLGYEGATVFTPDIGFYERPISVDDYSSLYPSCMIQKNLSHETLVNNDRYDNLEEYKYYNCEFSNADGSKTKCRFAKKLNGDKGIMPMILDKLLAQRKNVKKLMKNENDGFKKSIYDGLQLAYKVTANSLYGQIGSSVSPIYCKEIAASTTSTGREMLELARDYVKNVFPGIIESLYEGYKSNDEASVKKILEEELVDSLQNEKYYQEVKSIITKILNKVSCNIEVIYGDTDSIFIDWGMKQDDIFYKGDDVLEFAIDLGKISGDFIKSKLESPQDLEYEKTFYPFCILSKKRYVGNKYEFDVNKFSQNSMGIVLKRRDNAKIVKKIFGGMVDILLNEIDVDKAVNFIKSSISDLLKGKYPLHNFITSKTLKSKYADRTRLAHVCLADRMKERDPGNAPEINERVQYVAIVVNKNEIIKRKEDEFRVKMNKIINDEIKDGKKIRGENISRIISNLCKLDNSKKFLDGMEKVKKIDEIKDAIENLSVSLTDNKVCSIKGNLKSECESLYKGRVLQGDSIEHPDYIKENRLPVDYLFYLTNQIMNPTIQFLELLVKNPNDIFNEAISIENNRREGNQPITNWINVKKINNTNLVIKKTPSKNLAKYYLGDEEVDFDKLGELDDKKKKSKNNKSKLYLQL
jgi:DNA polymerase elongation subunit (family B)